MTENCDKSERPEEGGSQRGSLSRRNFLKLAGMAGATVAAGGGLAQWLAGCGDSTTTTTAATSSSSTTAASTASTVASSTTVSTGAAVQPLKIGYIGNLSFFIALDGLRCVEVMADMVNSKGGLKAGDALYKIEVVSYDMAGDQAQAVAAANRLISEDGVKFITDDGTQTGALVPITEASKIIYASPAPGLDLLNPEYKYCYRPLGAYGQSATLYGWLSETYPDKKKMVFAAPDDRVGDAVTPGNEAGMKEFGFDYTIERYPAQATDLSSLGTKIKQVNPDYFGMNGGMNFQPYAAAYNAGWRGTFLATGPIATDTFLATITAEMAEGLTGISIATEFDPPSTDFAKEFKERWTAKNGPWETPPTATASTGFPMIVAAIEKAGGIDVEAVAAAANEGLEYDDPDSHFKLISRPDLGIERAVDSVAQQVMKQVTGGKPEPIATVPVEKVLEYAARTGR